LHGYLEYDIPLICFFDLEDDEDDRSTALHFLELYEKFKPTAKQYKSLLQLSTELSNGGNSKQQQHCEDPKPEPNPMDANLPPAPTAKNGIEFKSYDGAMSVVSMSDGSSSNETEDVENTRPGKATQESNLGHANLPVLLRDGNGLEDKSTDLTTSSIDEKSMGKEDFGSINGKAKLMGMEHFGVVNHSDTVGGLCLRKRKHSDSYSLPQTIAVETVALGPVTVG
jgi:hypothetical protein